MSLSTNAPVDNVNSIATVTATHSDDISCDAARVCSKRQRGRTLQPGETKVPKETSAKLRTRTFREFRKTATGKVLSARDREVLEQLLNYGNNEHDHYVSPTKLIVKSFPCIRTIAAALGHKSIKPVRAALNNLKRVGVVDWTRTGRSSLYEIILPLHDTDRSDKRDQSAQMVTTDSADRSYQIEPKGSIALDEGTSTELTSKKEYPTTPTRTSEPTASANTSSIERGGGGVISFEKSGRAEEQDEQENERVSDAVEVLMCNGFNSRSQARTLVQSNKQITSEVVDYMLNSIEGTPENPIGIVRRKLQAPEDVQDVVDKLPKIKMLVERVERERQAAAARKAADEKAETERRHIEELAIQRARQRMIALTDERLWSVWAWKVAPAQETPEFNEQSLKNIRETILRGSSPRFDRSRIAAIVEKARAEELETLRQHVANGTAIEDLEKLPLKCDRDDDKQRNALAKVQEHIELMKLTPEQRTEQRIAKREAAVQARWAAEQSIAATGGGK